MSKIKRMIGNVITTIIYVPFVLATLLVGSIIITGRLGTDTLIRGPVHTRLVLDRVYRTIKAAHAQLQEEIDELKGMDA